MANWLRMFPDSDHRWTMGLRPGERMDFFAPQDDTGTLLPERAALLDAEPEKYSALPPDGEAMLRETVALARSLGATIGDGEKSDGASPTAPQALLAALGRTWEPDVVWLQRSGAENPAGDGVHRVVGGIVCFPSSWALADKIGRPMSEVHAPVPGLNDALGRQIDRFLDKLAPGDVWTRENWSLSRSGARNQHTSLQQPRLNWPRLDAATPLAEVWIRIERQVLLRLPESDAVLFGIRIESPPLATLLAEPIAAGRFARVLESMTDEAAAYKNFGAARPKIVAALRQAADAAAGG